MLLFIILVLILSIPSVQTKLGKSVTQRLNKDYKTNINIGKVGLQFNGDVELKEVLIKDYRLDTLIGISELNTSIINFRNLYNNKFNFGDVDIEGLLFNLKTYQGESDTNLDVFVEKFEEDNPKENSNKFLLSSSDVSITDGIFRLIDENKEDPKIIELLNLNCNATNFLIEGPDVSTRINKFSFVDSRGVEVKNLMADFKYTLTAMIFDKLNIKTAESELIGDLRFDYLREDLKDFTDKVLIEAKFKESTIQLTELNTFFNEFGTNQRARFNVDLSGSLNNLQADNLNISTSRNTKIIGAVNFKNIFKQGGEGFELNGDFTNLSSNYGDLIALLPNILGNAIPSVFAKVGNFRIKGKSFITTKIINADIAINTDLGFANSNLELTNIDNIDDANYVGNVILEDFNIGELLNDPKVKSTWLNLDVEGKGFTKDNIKTKVKGNVFYLEYNDYKYENVELSGDIESNIFNGILKANDKNLRLDFNGLADLSEEIRKFDFKANVGYANLKALNFVTRDSLSEFRGLVDMKVRGSNIDNLKGKVSVKNTTYKNQDNRYVFKDFSIISSFKNEERTIAINSPDIIEGTIKGKFKTDQILKLSENSVGSIYTNYKAHEVDSSQYLDFNFKIYNQIATVFFKDLNLGNNTYVNGRIETDEKKFKLKFRSPKIAYEDYFADNIKINVDNSNPVYNTFVELDSVSTGIYNVSDFSLINVTRNDTLSIKSEFKGGKRNDDIYDLNLFYTIDEDNNSVIGFRKSNVNFKGYDWTVNTDKDDLNKVIFDRTFKNFNIKDVRVNQYNEEILLAGVIADSSYKNLKLDFKDVELVKITPRLDSLAMTGKVNGQMQLLQNRELFLPKSNLVIENFNLNNYALGDLNAIVKGNNSLTNYNVDVKLQNDNIRSVDAKGTIDVDKKRPKIDMDVVFRDFLLDPLNPLGEGVISNIRGLVSGDVKVSGNLNKPNMNGELILDRAGLAIPYLNVDYSFDFDSEVSLKGQQFIFNNVAMTDSEYFSRGFLNGFIAHNNFSNWQLGLELNTDRLLVLNTEQSEDELYYGTAFVEGKADIIGPTNQLVIDVEGSTAAGTVFNIPLNDSESFGDNSYIKFLSPKEKIARTKGEVVTQREIRGLQLEFDLDVNQNAEIEIVIDKDSGSSIKGKGEGNLVFLINTNGTFNMWGDFAVYEGFYNFKYRSIVEKRFEVEQGGNIVWEGDPLNAEINLKAVYNTTANPSVLLDSPISQSIPVNLGINLTGRLEKPQPNFSFDFPNVNSTIKSELDYRLSSEEDRENQALYLLATGGFSGGSLDFTGTISERINGIINSILGDNDNFKIGLDLDLAENNPDFETDNRVGLTLQTKLSDKVIVNGKFGVPFGSATQTTIAGDVQIDWLLNDDGTLRAKVFNRENSIRNFGEEIGYTQGLGLSYNVEFDTFKELVQIIFSGKNRKDKKQKEEEKKDEVVQDNFLPDYISIKKEKTKKGQ